jgi:hypothetical protein
VHWLAELATLPRDLHLQEMRTDFSVFRERLTEACRVRDMSHLALCRGIGLSPKKAVDLQYSPLKALDLYRVTQIADALDVSLDWLLGRSNVRSVMEMPEIPGPETPKRKAKRSTLPGRGGQ